MMVTVPPDTRYIISVDLVAKSTVDAGTVTVTLPSGLYPGQAGNGDTAERVISGAGRYYLREAEEDVGSSIAGTAKGIVLTDYITRRDVNCILSLLC